MMTLLTSIIPKAASFVDKEGSKPPKNVDINWGLW